jgi:hypothetical protein
MHGTYVIDDINDIGTTFTESYPDLSARLYKIDITDNEIDDNDKLVFSLEGEGVSEVSILKYKKGNIEFVANSTSTISLKDIKKEYLDTGWNLFALVCNNRAVPPYTGKSFIDLKIDIVREQESPDYNHCGISIKVLGQYHATTPDTSYNYDSDGPIYSWEKYPGSFTENTFTGNYFREFPTFSISGSITVIVNETHDTIHSVSWTEEHTSPNFTKTYTGTAAGVPFAWYDMFRVEGESSCDHITSFSVNQSAPNGLNYSLKSYECAWDSKIVVSFSKE